MLAALRYRLQLHGESRGTSHRIQGRYVAAELRLSTKAVRKDAHHRNTGNIWYVVLAGHSGFPVGDER